MARITESIVLARVAAIQRHLPVIKYTDAGETAGFANSFASVPRTLPSAELPAFINFFSRRPIRRVRTTTDQVQVISSIDMLLLIMEGKQGAEFEAQALQMPYLLSVPDLFDSRRRLQLEDAGLAGVNEAFIEAITTGGGFDLLAFGGKRYVGIEFSLSVNYTRLIAAV